MQNINEQKYQFARCCLCFAMILFALFATQARGAQVNDIFAVVGDRVVTLEAFNAVLRTHLRQKFFHGNISPQDLKTASEDVGRALIDRELLLQEAARRGLKADEQAVAAKRLAINGPQVLDTALREESLLAALETLIRKVPEATREEVLQYHAEFPDKFTLPEQVRLSLILLAVPPYAKVEEWQGAYDKAVQLVEELRKGTEFAALAQQFSLHESAKVGGNLGLLHKGMLAEEVQRQLDALSVGQISEPLRLLQGIAVFRVDERVAPSLVPFEKAEARARSLLTREKEGRAWQLFLEELRQQKHITVNWPAP